MDEKHIFFNVSSYSEGHAVIEIDGIIGGYDWDTWERINTGKIIRKKLRALKDAKEIEVRITSHGGDVDQALQIYDALKDHPAHVTTIINGFCASAATLIALAGDVRRISSYALFLIHKCSSYVGGNTHELQMELEMQETVNETMFEMYKGVCKKSDKELMDLFDYDNGKGKWITAQEAVDFGFCTEIYNETQSSSAKVAMVDRKLYDALNYPKLPDNFSLLQITGEEVAEESLIKKILGRARELFAPLTDVSSNINQNQAEMKKFNLLFPLLALVLTGFADKDYDAEKGVVLDDDMLKSIEAKMQELKEAKETLETEKANLDATVKALESDKATLTAERDDYKAKYESKPANVPAVNGNDTKPEPVDVTDNAMYSELEKYL